MKERIDQPLFIALVSMCLALGCRGADEVKKLAVPDGVKIFLRLKASGDQIYKVISSPDGKLSWSPATPDAKLFNEKGAQVGVHGSGPHWSLMEGEKVMGNVLGTVPPAKKVAVDPTSIPWLELNAVPGSATDALKSVVKIQRIDTVGGLPPSEKLLPENIGKEFRVHYEAVYLLLETK